MPTTDYMQRKVKRSARVTINRIFTEQFLSDSYLENVRTANVD